MELKEIVQWSVLIQNLCKDSYSGRAVREEVRKLINRPQWKNLVVGPLVAKSVSLLGGAREIKAVCVDQVAYLPVGAQ